MQSFVDVSVDVAVVDTVLDIEVLIVTEPVEVALLLAVALREVVADVVWLLNAVDDSVVDIETEPVVLCDVVNEDVADAVMVDDADVVAVDDGVRVLLLLGVEVSVLVAVEVAVVVMQVLHVAGHCTLTGTPKKAPSQPRSLIAARHAIKSSSTPLHMMFTWQVARLGSHVNMHGLRGVP